MDIQVLISTINQKDYSLLEKMNIQTDAIVINQCDRNEVTKFKFRDLNILWMSFDERGVGLSRNSALMRATADICLMADDDMVYVDGYKQIVIDTFNKKQKSDMIMFNVPIHKNDGRSIVKVKKNGRVRFLNALKYGTVNFAFKREIILKNNIYFSLLFGGGSRYGSGEDSIFVVDALKNGLKLYSSTEIVANIKEDESTWFTGYNERYFFDRGALFAAIGGKLWSLFLIIQFIIRKRKIYSKNITSLTAYRQMIKGRDEFFR